MTDVTQQSIKTLNKVTKTLIDSHKGYEKCIETADDDYVLQSQFAIRANQRQDLINRFQTQTLSLGGEPETDGSMLGKAYRVVTDFSSMFRDNERAALSAVDDGEEYLADQIKDELQDHTFTPETRVLLLDTHKAAQEGERFADRLENFRKAS